MIFIFAKINKVAAGEHSHVAAIQTEERNENTSRYFLGITLFMKPNMFNILSKKCILKIPIVLDQARLEISFKSFKVSLSKVCISLFVLTTSMSF